MLFSFNRVLLAAITAFAFLQLAFAIPVPQRLTADHHQFARQEIANMGLSGQDALDMKNWHENHLINEMRTNPHLFGVAQHGVVYHTAHQGGSDPDEPNHISATFYDKNGDPIRNRVNGGTNHHVYVPRHNPGLNRAGQRALQRANVHLRQNSL